MTPADTLEPDMPTFTCPNCRHLLEVTLIGPEPKPNAQYIGTVPIAGPTSKNENTRAAYEAARELVSALIQQGWSVITSQEAMEWYERDFVSKGAPPLSPVGLAAVLKFNGCHNWRNANLRGFRIPEELPDMFEATSPDIPHIRGNSSYEDTLTYHSIDRSVDGTPIFEKPADPLLAELPFAIDTP